MPRRVRRQRVGGPIPYTLDVVLALSLGPHPSAKPGDRKHFTDEQLRQAWVLFAPRLLACGPAHTHWAYWAFDPAVPDDLRAERPGLAPLDLDTTDTDLEARRAAWLASRDNNTPEHTP